eukprot:Amastigsp_a637_6.p4 type:complete len:116 gc:universal Amastigsp_a637_6:661-314(-)
MSGRPRRRSSSGSAARATSGSTTSTSSAKSPSSRILATRAASLARYGSLRTFSGAREHTPCRTFAMSVRFLRACAEIGASAMTPNGSGVMMAGMTNLRKKVSPRSIAVASAEKSG